MKPFSLTSVVVAKVLTNVFAGLASIFVMESTLAAAVTPKVVGQWLDSAIPDGAVDVQVAGNIAYVAYGYGGVNLISVADVTKPVKVANAPTAGYASGVHVVGNLAYVADGIRGGMAIFNVNDPAKPILLSRVSVPGPANAVRLKANVAYVAAGAAGLVPYDVSNPASPVRLVTQDSAGNAVAVALSGNYAYLCDVLLGGMTIYDLSNPARPVTLGTYKGDGWVSVSVHDVALRGSTAYLACGYDGFWSVDVSNPSRPTTAGYVQGYYATGVKVVETVAYFLDDTQGLKIVDISNPAKLTQVGSLDTLKGGNRLDVVGTRVFVAAGSQGLFILESTTDTAVAPTITQDLTNQTVTIGDQASLRVSANGSAPLQYQWQFNGINIPAGTNAILILSNVQSAAAGNYAVIVSNSAGSIQSSTAVLTVIPRPIPIDLPTFQWAKRAVNTGSDSTPCMLAADAAGNHYVAGYFSGTGVFGGAAEVRLSSRGGSDIFVAKYDRTGELLWVKQAGGSGDDAATSVSVDAAGNCYATGYFTNSCNFGSTSLLSNGGYDVFLLKFDSGGNFQWARHGGSAGDDAGSQVAMDGAGNVCVVGSVTGTADFSLWKVVSAGGTDIFLAKYNAEGNLLWARNDGGAQNDSGSALAIDPSGNLLVGGTFQGTTRFGGTALSSVGGWDGFVAKYTSAGDFVWAQRSGGLNSEGLFSVAADGQGNSYLTVAFSGTVNFGSVALASAGGYDTCVAKYNPSGQILWVRSVGSTNDDYIARAVVDTAGNAYTVGTFTGTLDLGNSRISTAGGWDVLICKYDSAGQLLWGKQAGGTGFDAGQSLILANGGVTILSHSYGIGRFDSISVTNDSRTGDLLLASLNSGAEPLSPPVITLQPKTQTEDAGRDVTFSVTATGSGPLLYQWKFNNSILTGATNSTLILLNVQPANAGSYSVVVSNSAGSVLSGVASLTVNSIVEPNLAPGFRWVSATGGEGDDAASSIGVDTKGNQYVSGYFQQRMAFASETIQSRGDFDIFLAKYDPSGSHVWVRQLGGQGHEVAARGLAVDGAGNSYITGAYGSAGEAIQIGSLTLTNAGNYDLFLAKLNPEGDLLWARRAGGNDADFGNGVALDQDGNSYVTGNFRGTANFGATNVTSSGMSETFVAKYDPSGNLVWIKTLGGTQRDSGVAVRVDASGSCYLAARFEGSVIVDKIPLTSGGSMDILLAKLDANGSVLWARQISGQSGDQYYGWSLALDSGSHVYLAGQFTSTANFGTVSLTTAGGNDAFLAKYDKDGNLVWTRQAGGTGNDYGYNVVIDSGGNAYLGGSFSSTAQFGTLTMNSAGGSDMFVSKYDPSGKALWVRRGGGSGSDFAIGLASALSGRIHIAGQFALTATLGEYTMESRGMGDLYVGALNLEGEIGALPVITTSPASQRVTIGDPVTFAVVAIGPKPLLFQWRLGGAIMPGATNPVYSIPSAGRNHEGDYDVLVSNAAGTAQSVRARLTVSANIYAFTTLAGSTNSGANDGKGKDARFRGPTALAVDENGNVYVADTLNSTIRKITPDGLVTTIAGAAGQTGSLNGVGSQARFHTPFGITISESSIYVSDTFNFSIRRIAPDGTVSLFAGVAGSAGVTDGDETGRFALPGGLASYYGVLYVADSLVSTIRSVSDWGWIWTVSGTPYTSGATDGDISDALFNHPVGVAVDSDGRILVADSNNHVIRAITDDLWGGNVVTLAGKAGLSGSADGAAQTARFSGPNGVAVDLDGNAYVSDSKNHTIRKISRAGMVTTIGGAAGQVGSADGIGTIARFSHPWGIVVDRQGNLYIADADNNSIRKGIPVDPDLPQILGQPQDRSAEEGASLTLTVTASGPGPLTYQWQFNGVPMVGEINPGLNLRNISTAQAGAYSVLVSNSAGSVLSDIATLTVIPGGPSVLSFTPQSGAPGSLIQILGTNLSKVSSVSLNGLSMQFLLNSDSELTFAVPGSASTGSLLLHTITGPNVPAGTFTVLTSANPPPTVRIESPSKGQTFSYPADFMFQASANDPNGTISQMDYYANGKMIYSVETLPVPAIWTSYHWVNAPAGTYNLIAVAIDDRGARAFSEPVVITVADPIRLLVRQPVSRPEIVLTWPASAAGYILETCTELRSAQGWTKVSGSPSILNESFTTTQQITGPTRFYRLRKAE